MIKFSWSSFCEVAHGSWSCPHPQAFGRNRMSHGNLSWILNLRGSKHMFDILVDKFDYSNQWISHHFQHFAQKDRLNWRIDQNLNTPWTMLPLFRTQSCSTCRGFRIQHKDTKRWALEEYLSMPSAWFIVICHM